MKTRHTTQCVLLTRKTLRCGLPGGRCKLIAEPGIAIGERSVSNTSYRAGQAARRR